MMTIDKVLIIVSAIIKDKQGRILLLQRSEKSSYPGCWQLVEGKMEKGESPDTSLKREINEEIGVIGCQIKINTVVYNKIEAKGLKYLCFRIVYDVEISSDEIKTSDEHVSFGWFGKEEIKKLTLMAGTEEVLDKIL